MSSLPRSATRKTTQGKLFVVSGPSGVGKDALLETLFVRVPGLVRSVSAATRPPRPGETDGADYFFLTRAEFEADVAQGRFLEFAEYGGELYGTPRAPVAEARESGRDVVLKIEVQGGLQTRRLEPQAVLIFIQPPSLEELERRLRSRGTDDEERILRRLAVARHEMDAIPLYDYLIVNDDFDSAADLLCAVILAERCRISKSD